jgi:hypothetical protein
MSGLSLMLSVLLIGVAFQAFPLDKTKEQLTLPINDFAIMTSNGARLYLLEDIDKAIAILGTFSSKRIREWGYVEYAYSGIVIARPKNKQGIYLIKVDSKDYRTKRNISVGDDLDKVMTTYGGNKYLHWGSKNAFLYNQIIVTDGKVDQNQDMASFDSNKSLVYSLSFVFTNRALSQIILNIAPEQ